MNDLKGVNKNRGVSSSMLHEEQEKVLVINLLSSCMTEQAHHACSGLLWNCCYFSLWLKNCTLSFKLPLNLSVAEAPTCNISKGTALAEVLSQCRLIVWNECTMTNKAAFEQDSPRNSQKQVPHGRCNFHYGWRLRADSTCYFSRNTS